MGQYLAVGIMTKQLSSEEKIMMESSGNLFPFFESNIRDTYKQFALSKAIRVYILG